MCQLKRIWGFVHFITTLANLYTSATFTQMHFYQVKAIDMLCIYNKQIKTQFVHQSQM